MIKQYDEIRNSTAGEGDNYTTGCLLDYHYFEDHCHLNAIDLSKQKKINADLRAIQRIDFYGMLKLTQKNIEF